MLEERLAATRMRSSKNYVCTGWNCDCALCVASCGLCESSRVVRAAEGCEQTDGLCVRLWVVFAGASRRVACRPGCGA